MIDTSHLAHAVRTGPHPADSYPLPNALPASSATATGARGRRVDSTELMDGHTEIEILHRDAVYRLRLTTLGKLILTK